MPFTPYHFGPGFLIGILLVSFVDLSAILIASVILDLEPLAIILFGLSYPLHGIFHTYLAATIVSIFLTIVLWQLRGFFSSIVSLFGIHQESKVRSILLSCILGTYSHVLLDSFLYAEMNPFYPFLGNPFVNLIQGEVIYDLCVVTGLLGFSFYIGYLLYGFFKSRNLVESTNHFC